MTVVAQPCISSLVMYANASVQKEILAVETSLHLAPIGLVKDDEQRMASQLIHLASQYHASEYNRVKFGPKGNPTTYIPISLQAPALVEELRSRQTLNTQQQAWWPCTPQVANFEKEDPVVECVDLPSPPVDTDVPIIEAESLIITSPIMTMPPQLDLKKEISAAMASPLSRLPSIPNGTTVHLTKTSETHPINISMIIPLELLHVVSAYASPASSPSPFMFHIPPNFYLDRMTAPMQPPPVPNHPPSWRHSITTFEPMLHPLHDFSGASLPYPPELWEFAANTGVLVPSGLPMAAPIPSLGHLPLSASPRKTLRRLMTESPPIPVDVPTSSSPQERALSAPPLEGYPSKKAALSKSPKHTAPTYRHGRPTSTYINQSLDPNSTRPLKETTFTKLKRPLRPASAMMSSSDSESSLDQNPLIRYQSWTGLSYLTKTPMELASVPPLPPQYDVSSLGNLFLSSCPGKKVRLAGPVRGRGSICRDLRQDLCRMKELGVGCIICCLDDEELKFLGASWPEYSAIANEIGIDVLRLPTPEGLVPLDPASFNAHLSRLIDSYTIRGLPILVHCRGGVGRAGLVACCWLLKLGLCGWKNPALCRCHWPAAASADHGVCKAALHLVERVICVVRRRRSLKAVETYEQVKFLVDFVEYLDATQRRPPFYRGRGKV